MTSSQAQRLSSLLQGLTFKTKTKWVNQRKRDNVVGNLQSLILMSNCLKKFEYKDLLKYPPINILPLRYIEVQNTVEDLGCDY